jgi:hypothetical protein
MTAATPENVVVRKRAVVRKRIRGETIINRSKNRDRNRDAVMQMVFATPGLAMVIAKRIRRSHQSVSAWKRVPAHHVLEVAPLLGLTPEQVRPDVFQPKRRNR